MTALHGLSETILEGKDNVAADNASWGTDLQLLGSLQWQNERQVHDLHAAAGDLALYSGQANLMQALYLRFLTRVGELAPLGHPAYGSRLHELLGEPNTALTRQRARMFVLQALEDEPRVVQVLSVEVTPAPADPVRLKIALTADVRVEGIIQRLNLVFPFFLEGGWRI
ncbi:MAG: hypothetical protein OHK0046_41960 [Anaerolineae bacterium]